MARRMWFFFVHRKRQAILMLCPAYMPLSSERMEFHSLTFPHALLARITSAKSSIFIASYLFFFNPSRKSSMALEIASTLSSRAVHDNLDVRLVVSYPKGFTPKSGYRFRSLYWLAAAGVPFRFAVSPRNMHLKLIVIDQRFIVIGSHNMYDASFENPLELSAFLDSPPAATLLHTSFDRWWRDLAIAPFADGVTWPA